MIFDLTGYPLRSSKNLKRRRHAGGHVAVYSFVLGAVDSQNESVEDIPSGIDISIASVATLLARIPLSRPIRPIDTATRRWNRWVGV